MNQVTYNSVADALLPFEGLGVIVLIAIGVVLLWEAAIVISVLIATLSGRPSRRSATPHR